MMQNPYRKLTGFKKALAIFITVLIVSLGLCGINFGLFTQTRDIFARAPAQNSVFARATGILVFSGLAELAGIAIGLLGVIVSLLLMAYEAITRPKPH